jgi:hypothetical protein
MTLGDCAAVSSRTIRRYGAPFRCPPNDKIAGAAVLGPGRHVYPWRDNFCETRGYFVGQCPSGLGHQGQDIVPVDCRLSSKDTDCERSEHRVVAVHDGVVLRSPGQEGLVIVANAANAHLRFRYLHMNPKIIDDGGFLSGRVVREGETVGRVGNYSGREAGTSYHLHFDMQVPTKDGWVLVNPYMTLVLAYERLIGARGEEIHEEIKKAPVAEADAAASVAPGAKTIRQVKRSQQKSWRSKQRVQARTKYYRM